MDVIIIRKFKDKNTKQWHEIDDKVSVSKERYEEIKDFCKPLEKENTETITDVESVPKRRTKK